jgi:hypothetical protein
MRLGFFSRAIQRAYFSLPVCCVVLSWFARLVFVPANALLFERMHVKPAAVLRRAADDALCSVMLLYAAVKESAAVRAIVAASLLSTMCGGAADALLVDVANDSRGMLPSAHAALRSPSGAGCSGWAARWSR